MSDPARASEAPGRWGRWTHLYATHAFALDSVLAVALFVLGFIGLANGTLDATHTHAPDAIGYLFVLLGTAPIALRRRYPVPVLAILVFAAVAYTALELPENNIPVSVLFALYTVAAWETRRVSLVALGGVVVAAAVAAILDSNELDLGGIFNNFVLFTVAYLIGYSVRVRRAYIEQLELRAEDLERTRHEEAERAVATERLRMARELHDVVAHTMSIVAVQSGIAAHVMEQRPDEAKRMLESIAAASRDALDELRGMLGVLRADADSSALPELAPSATLHDLDALAKNITDSGVEVTVHVTGDRPAIPMGIDLSVYRIVQEALTNVLKHAGPARAEVNIAYSAEALEVEILDDGRGAAASARTLASGGHGLVGMRERVTVYGGTLDAAPRPGGGYRVAACLPLAGTGGAEQP